MKVIIAVSGTNKYFGMPKYYYLLANELSKLKIDIELIIDSDRTDIVKEFTTVKTTTIKPLVNNAINTMLFCWKLNKYLKKTKFDILHTCHVLPYYYLKNKVYKPVVFQPFGNELFTLAGKGLNKTYCNLAQPILRECGNKADILIAEGEFQFEDMNKWYKNPNMRVLPVGIDTSKFNQSTPYKNSIFTVLSVNSLTKYDRMDLLIDAFKIFHSSIKKSQLIIVGKGKEEGYLRTKARNLPVVFLKDVPERRLIKLYQESDVYVSTTSETDMQMGIIEAMASGLPIIATGQRYMIKGNGFVVSSNAEEIFTAMSKTYYGNRESMGNVSKMLSMQYDFKKIAQKAVEIYKELI